MVMKVLMLPILFVLATLWQALSYQPDPYRVRLDGVKWMHIQKTSSWLGDFLLLFACPHLRPLYDSRKNKVFFYDLVRQNTTLLEACEIPVVPNRDGSYGWHDPYHPSSSRNKLVTVFRNPEDRIISSFLFGDMMIPSGSVYSHNQTLPSYIRESSTPLLAYASVPGFDSCQTKMVLGYYCGQDVKGVTSEGVAEAKRRIEYDFAFFGLTEESAATAQLFYAMYKYDDRPPYMNPHTLRYRGNAAHSGDAHDKLLQQLKEHHWADAADQELYRHAQAIFYERCAYFNIPTQHNVPIRQARVGKPHRTGWGLGFGF